jgi:protein TonB
MEATKILSVDLIDVVFDGRNKAYGAYELRKTYSGRINKALFITMTFAALICTGAIIASTSKKNKPQYRIRHETILTDIVEKKIEPKPKPEKQPEVKPQKTIIFTAPVIKEVVETPMPPQDDMDSARIGLTKVDGPADDGIPKPDDIDKGTGVVEQKVEKESDEPFRTVEIDAKFIGNWKSFLERNLNAEVPRDNGAPAGRYSVVVEFVVDKEGKVSDIKTLTYHGYGLEEEAVRVLKKAPKWEPAIQNGMEVKAYRRQVITFEVSEEG